MRRAFPALFLAFATLISGCNEKYNPFPGPGPAPTPPPLEAGPGVTAIFGGLKKGDPLGTAQVVLIEAPKKGLVRITISEGDAQAVLIVALQGDGPLPIASTKKYALFSGGLAGKQPGMAGESITKAIEALAERIKASEDATPTPAGITAYGQKTAPM